MKNEIIHLFDISRTNDYLNFLKTKNIYFDNNKIPKNNIFDVYINFLNNVNELDLNNSKELEK